MNNKNYEKFKLKDTNSTTNINNTSNEKEISQQPPLKVTVTGMSRNPAASIDNKIEIPITTQPSTLEKPSKALINAAHNDKVSDISREEIVTQIFGDAGDVLDDFSCAIESVLLLHGRMYITSKFICFYAHIFGMEKKIRIPYNHITIITKEKTALVIPNAIAITTCNILYFNILYFY
jgi:hypothetical protein